MAVEKYWRMKQPPLRKYALVTPARNEEAHVGATIESVLAQRLRPGRWIIIDDGSTDRTEVIAREYAMKHPLIRVLHREPDGAAGFASKVRAFAMGWEGLRRLDFDFVGSLDADVTFEADFFERLLDEFLKNPRLGVAGGWICEKRSGRYRPRFGNSDRDVAGAVQLFRRRCFEEAGGFPELPYGGEDAAAQSAARMHGWEVSSFPHLRVEHHKVPGGGLKERGRQQFLEGVRDYALGYHPLYLGLKCVRRTFARPWLVGGACRMVGYAWAWTSRVPQGPDPRTIAFARREQMDRIREIWGRT
mgnify:CR=1 FL=1